MTPDPLARKGVRLDADELIALRAEVLLDRGQDPPLSMRPGAFVMKRRGLGQDIADTRAYVDGDDLRHLDRGATARTGTLHIRTYQQERDRITLLVADFRPCMFWGMTRAFRSIAAAEALAYTGWQVIEAGGRAGLLAITAQGQTYVAARGRTRGMLDVIRGMVTAHNDALAASAQETEPPLDVALRGLRRVAPTGSEIVVATSLDMPGDSFRDVMGDLARRRHPRLIIVDEAAAKNLPPGEYPIRTSQGRVTRARIGPQTDFTSQTDISEIPMIHLDSGQATSGQLRQLSG